MPWKEMSIVNARMEFVKRLKAGERMLELCKEFGISRPTGYKFLERYEQFGEAGLFDTSRRPKHLARKTSEPIERFILELKRTYPTWGARKILEKLQRAKPTQPMPVRSTVHDILDRHGLVNRRSKRHRYKAVPTERREAFRANDLWCGDFKGQFRLKNNQYCYPLTLTDYISRYVISCESLESTSSQSAKSVFEFAFREYGLPSAILTDNGVPFSSRSLRGLSRLGVWLLKLGVRLERIAPGHPEQNGRHERMHLTLKKETTRPAGRNILHQQEIFDEWRKIFNHERPHEALDMKTPSELYSKSSRPFPEHLPEPEYPGYDKIKTVLSGGKVHFQGKNTYFFLSETLSSEKVGLIEEDEDLWRVSFMNVDLGYLDSETMKFKPCEEPLSS